MAEYPIQATRYAELGLHPQLDIRDQPNVIYRAGGGDAAYSGMSAPSKWRAFQGPASRDSIAIMEQHNGHSMSLASI